MYSNKSLSNVPTNAMQCNAPIFIYANNQNMHFTTVSTR